jgi:hypothetical protein
MMSKKSEKIHHVNGVRVGFSHKKITSYGGFSLLAMFFEKINLKQALRGLMPIEEVSPNAMKAEEKLVGLITLIITGASRFSHLLYLGNPEIIKTVFGLKRLPLASSTLTRYFNKIKNRGQADHMSDWIWAYLKTVINWTKVESDWLSFDSTVITRYGEQDGAKKGYNPTKKGRASHHPLIAFLNRSKIVLNLWNRSGDTASASNIIAFFENCYERVLPLIKITGVLADSGFYLESFIKAIESKGLHYVITAKLYSTVQRKIYETRTWTEIEPGLCISVFMYRHPNWAHPRRYVGVRQSVKKRKKALGRQLRLFNTDLETQSYRFGVWVTNMTEDPLIIWRAIRMRSNDENTIKELKEDLALSGFSMTQFYATEAAILVRCLVYNVLLVFKTTFLPEKERTQRIATIRFKYFIIPAHLGRDSASACLRLSAFPHACRASFQAIMDRISHYSIPTPQLHCS